MCATTQFAIEMDIWEVGLLEESGGNRYLVQNTRIRSYIGHENKIFKKFFEKVCILCIFWRYIQGY